VSAALSSHQIQVLALYTVFATKGPVPRHVVETSLALCDVNVFQIQEALYDLIKNENLTRKYDENQTEYLFLTPQGRCVVEELCKEAPLSYREKALAYAAVEMSKLRTQIGVEASVVKAEKGNETDYTCNISISDAGMPLIALSLYCPNKLQGEMMAERFRKNPLDIYRKILHIMTGTDETTEE
jgi:hypothetical protein